MMLAVLEAIEHVGELGRLFLMFSRFGVRQVEEKALIEACKRTAGLSIRYPRPIPAISLALSFGVMVRRQGFVSLTEQGKVFAGHTNSSGVELSIEQSKLLLGCLLDDSGFARVIKEFMSSFQLVNGRFVTRRNAVSNSREQHLVSRVLQQLNALKSDAVYFSVTPSFACLLRPLIMASAKLSHQELLRQIELQRKRGELAEHAVVELEVRRLHSLDRSDLAAQVEHTGMLNVSAGYDIRSFEKNGDTRYIEVKSSVGSQIRFEWSENERRTAKQFADSYYIYFVPFAFTLPQLTAPVVTIHNPIAFIENGKLVERSASYIVTYTGQTAETDKMTKREAQIDLPLRHFSR